MWRYFATVTPAWAGEQTYSLISLGGGFPAVDFNLVARASPPRAFSRLYRDGGLEVGSWHGRYRFCEQVAWRQRPYDRALCVHLLYPNPTRNTVRVRARRLNLHVLNRHTRRCAAGDFPGALNAPRRSSPATSLPDSTYTCGSISRTAATSRTTLVEPRDTAWFSRCTDCLVRAPPVSCTLRATS